MLRVESNGPVLYVTLERPDVRNALDEELIQDLYETFTTVAEPTRVVVLAGDGLSFCAGGDLNYMRRVAAYTEEQNYEDAFRLAWVFQSMLECPVPIVAKIHGATFGGGCGLVAAADVAVAASDAQFAFSEVRLGLVPATISPFVIQKIGAGHARSLFTTGELFNAERALHIGLIHDMVVHADLAFAVERRVKAILAAGPKAVSEAKRIAQNPPLSLEESARLLAKIRSTDEAREGVSAFLERRPARYAVSP
ncbi:MAG: enoyl-CoA hydratase-related protein [Fimbriimonas sp.]|nr:enoyl-CoA hydratase-related protein [Fimbriimonas sp.]